MKPSNIFCSQTKFFDIKIKGQSKKNGKGGYDKIACQNEQIKAQKDDEEEMKEIESGNYQFNIFKQRVLNRLENNMSLNELL